MSRSPHGEISEARYLTQSFAYESAQAADERFAGGPGFIYQRFGNPTTQMFEDRLALLEGADVCRATASGMSAVHVSLMGLLRAGDHLVAGRALFGSNSWILLKALETLELRVRKQTDNAGRVADAIAASGKVRQTIYCGRPDHPQAAIIANQMTGGGNVIAFDLGDRAAAWRFLDALQIVDISNNLGDAKSMATHPCTTTHRSMPEAERLEIGLTEGWVRMSVGLEGAGDLSRDVSRALDAA